jgi:14-3-3 protein epsilon
LSEESYKDSTLIMQLLRDNLVRFIAKFTYYRSADKLVLQTLWTSSEAEAAPAETSAAHAESKDTEPAAEAKADE